MNSQIQGSISDCEIKTIRNLHKNQCGTEVSSVDLTSGRLGFESPVCQVIPSQSIFGLTYLIGCENKIGKTEACMPPEVFAGEQDRNICILYCLVPGEWA